MYDCSGFLPVAVNFLRRVPVIGMLLYLPGISHVCNHAPSEVLLLPFHMLHYIILDCIFNNSPYSAL